MSSVNIYVTTKFRFDFTVFNSSYVINFLIIYFFLVVFFRKLKRIEQLYLKIGIR